MFWSVDLRVMTEDEAFCDDVNICLQAYGVPYEMTAYIDGLTVYAIQVAPEALYQEIKILVARNIDSVRHYVVEVI